MSVQGPTMKVKKSSGMDEKIQGIYVNYMQLMLDAAKDKAFKEELFSSNEKRLQYLNEKVGMSIPAGVHVKFVTKGLDYPKIYIKNKEGRFWVDEGAQPFKIVEKMNKGEEVTTTMKVASREELDVDIHQAFESGDIVLQLPFLDAANDLMLFELKYDDTEIIFSTCCA